MALESQYKHFYAKLHPDPALVLDPQRQAAVIRVRFRTPSPTKSTPCYKLDGLAIHPDFQGYGIGTLLVRWGMDRAAEEKVPVFAAGEERGVAFYEKALGFRRLAKTEYWLDRDAKEVGREEVEMGNVAWRTANGGISGCEVCWCPDGVVLDADGFVEKDKIPKVLK
jgi:GNAT superfamily N-acetyltransferase